METLELGKYFDKRGSAVLANEHRLQELGLDVIKTQIGVLVPVGSGGVLGLYDLVFERRDQHFSAELVEFLKDQMKLSPSDIQKLEKQSMYREPQKN